MADKNRLYSPATLAYLGDAVFELLTRKRIISESDLKASMLHKKNKELVNAKAQAAMYFNVEPLLTEKELKILKSGRNAKTLSKSKNASIVDYRHATGLEALLGYLFLENDEKRLLEIFEACFVQKGENNE